MNGGRPLLAVCVLLAACSSGGGKASTPSPAGSTMTGSKATSSSTAPSPMAAPLPVAQWPTLGTSFSLQHVPLAAGDGVSMGMHPSPAPITLRATATTPLAVCHDLDPNRGGTGLGWAPGHPFNGCHALLPGRWVQLPSTDSSADHVAFRVIAQRAGTISSLEVSYQRIDAFLIVEAGKSALTSASVMFTPTGRSVAASVYGLTPNSEDQNTGPAGVVSVSQAGSGKQQTGPCTFPTEANICFIGLRTGLPAAVQVLHSPATPWLLLALGLP